MAYKYVALFIKFLPVNAHLRAVEAVKEVRHVVQDPSRPVMGGRLVVHIEGVAEIFKKNIGHDVKLRLADVGEQNGKSQFLRLRHACTVAPGFLVGVKCAIGVGDNLRVVGGDVEIVFRLLLSAKLF